MMYIRLMVHKHRHKQKKDFLYILVNGRKSLKCVKTCLYGIKYNIININHSGINSFKFLCMTFYKNITDTLFAMTRNRARN